MSAEILAPASSFDMVQFAVQNGANAVYVGLSEFNARRNAKNFTLDELKSVIGFCHIRGVSVYLTVNIIIKDSEIHSAVNLIKEAYILGIDAVIICDLGLASIVKAKFPNLKLHASTQLSVHNVQGVKALQQLGFSRVCLARELSLDEICEIKNNTSMELEVFVHGAHCMSVSGQCYFSAIIGGRSGNRGLCGQICRLPFKNGKTDYALSLKDMSVLEKLPKLADIGIASFKIEGRMKRPEYVAAAVSACKSALVAETDFSQKYEILEKVFSRSGFTSGYLDNKRDENMFGIRRKEDIAEEHLLKQIRNAQKENPLIPVTAEYVLKYDEPSKLILSDKNNTVTVTGDIPKPAQSRPLDYQSAFENLSKLGGTPYYLTDFKFSADGDYFMPKSKLNEIRRDAVELLNQKRAEVPARRIGHFDFVPTGKSHDFKEFLLTFEKASQIPQNAKDCEIYLSAFETDENFKKLIDSGFNIGVTFPTCYFKNDALLKSKLLSLKELGVKNALCNNIYAIYFANELGFSLVAGSGLNLFNGYALKTAQDMGVRKSVLSFEMTVGEINNIKSDGQIGIMAYGKLPLMTVRACPIMKNCKDCSRQEILTDRLGNHFTMLCKDEYRQLLNNVPLCIKNKDRFSVDFLMLSFTDEDKDTAEYIIDCFKSGRELTGSYTNGLYNRGVM